MLVSLPRDMNFVFPEHSFFRGKAMLHRERSNALLPMKRCSFMQRPTKSVLNVLFVEGKPFRNLNNEYYQKFFFLVRF